MIRQAAAAVIASMTLAAAARAADMVTLLDGPPVNGKVVEMSTTEVTVDQNPIQKKIPVNEINWISYDEEPAQAGQARQAFLTGNLPRAASLLGNIKTDGINRKEIVQEIDYLKAATAALQLAGNGDATAAVKALVDFAKANRTNYRFYNVCELLGDLKISQAKFAEADRYYAQLTASPWPNLKMRGQVLLGRALAARKEHPQAIAKFDEVLAINEAGKDAAEQHLAATLGKATSLAATKQVEPAIKLVTEVIEKTSDENAELLARAHNALGNCYRLAGKDKDALWSFLYTDLMYSSAAEQHAEALANLGDLWEKADKSDRAKDAKARLKENYPQSRWATAASSAEPTGGPS